MMTHFDLLDESLEHNDPNSVEFVFCAPVNDFEKERSCFTLPLPVEGGFTKGRSPVSIQDEDDRVENV